MRTVLDLIPTMVPICPPCHRCSGCGSGSNDNGCGDVVSGCGNGDGRGKGNGDNGGIVGGKRGGNGGNCTTTDVHHAILLWYAEVIDIGRDNNDDRAPAAPAINGGDIEGGGLPKSTMVCGVHGGISNNGGERAVIPAVVVAAGRGGVDALAGGKDV
jgi:hypothetical protein